MEAFKRLTGLVCPLDRNNVDTDAIIPKQYLKSIKRTGFGVYAFDDWRYLDHGDLTTPIESRRPNPDFVLNEAKYQGAEVLVARTNFGCGSSREHAVWALQQQGFKVVIAESFADIFFNNCFKNGVLPIALPNAAVEKIVNDATAGSDYKLDVNLEAQTVTTPDGEAHSFEIDSFRKHCLINGLDDIGLTLQQADDIRAFESRRSAEAPWLFKNV